jgi:protein phosphatase
VSLFRSNDSGICVTVAARSDVGRSRSHNEDSLLVADLTTQDTSINADPHSYTLGRKGSILLVADGMGGALGGEIASQMATKLIHRELVSTWSTDPDDSPERFATCIREAVQGANHQIHARSKAQSDLSGMGTTATLAGILGPRVFLNQVGDSRAYLIRAGVVVQLTKDQSFVQGLVDTGRVSEERALEMAPKNIVLQALGPRPTVDDVQTWQPIARGDTILLCSDGLSGVVTAAEMGQIVTDGPDLARACEQLVALANSRGGPDNITVILARVTGNDLKSPQEVEFREPS